MTSITETAQVEGTWYREDGASSILLYTLRQKGWHRGEPVLVNDLTITIQRVQGSEASIEDVADRLMKELQA
jgi:hypothetical protein